MVSGGQTGADQGGLLVALDLDLKVGGWAPKGWKTENGSDEKKLRDMFHLKEYSRSGYPARTQANVKDSDATVVFRFQPSLGSDATISWAQTEKWNTTGVNIATTHDGYRPVFVVTSFENEQAVQLRKFLICHKVKVLNVAGHRASTAPDRDFQHKVREFLRSSLSPSGFLV